MWYIKYLFPSSLCHKIPLHKIAYHRKLEKITQKGSSGTETQLTFFRAASLINLAHCAAAAVVVVVAVAVTEIMTALRIE